MPTSTFAVTADADDVHGRMQSGSTWAAIASGVYTDNPFGSTLASVAKHGASSVFYVVNAFFLFDMDNPVSGTVIDAGGTISSGALKLYVDGSGAPDGATFAADYYDFGGSPSTSADWEQSSSGDCVSSVSVGSLTTSAVNTIALTGLSGVVKTGKTGIRFAPADTVAPTADNFIDFAAREHTTGQEPRLEITWTAATQAIRPDADITTTGWTTTPLWSKIEETSADGTVITATAS
jgi:hypothetical protein